MITKTEVDEALRRTEADAGYSALYKKPVMISAGDLFILREAAKRAPYHERNNWSAGSNSNMILGLNAEFP